MAVRSAHRISHHPICPLPDGTWEHPPIDEVLECCGLLPIATYIAKCKTTLLNQPSNMKSLTVICLYQQCIMWTKATLDDYGLWLEV